jgi:hypothetical protein
MGRDKTESSWFSFFFCQNIPLHNKIILIPHKIIPTRNTYILVMHKIFLIGIMIFLEEYFHSTKNNEIPARIEIFLYVL